MGSCTQARGRWAVTLTESGETPPTGNEGFVPGAFLGSGVSWGWGGTRNQALEEHRGLVGREKGMLVQLGDGLEVWAALGQEGRCFTRDSEVDKKP